MPQPQMMDRLSNPNTKKGRLRRACLELLREHERDGSLPTSNRFLFYELVACEIILKAYRHADGSLNAQQPPTDVSEATKHLREIGRVPCDAIVDETRTLDSWEYAGSVSDYVSERLDEARIDLWDGEAPPLILCESRLVAGVLRRIAAQYRCPIASDQRADRRVPAHERRPAAGGLLLEGGPIPARALLRGLRPLRLSHREQHPAGAGGLPRH